MLPLSGYTLSFLRTVLIHYTTPVARTSSSAPREQEAIQLPRSLKVCAEVIRSIIDRYGPEGASLKDLRIAAISTLGFAGFFRFNELANIQPSHLTFHDDFVKIFVPKSKTDVYREGNCVYIAKLESNYCPVSILRRYIEAAKLNLSSQLPLFRALTKKKSGYTLSDGKLSYTRCGYKRTEKRVENTTRCGAFLTNFEVFGNMVTNGLECFIYLLNQNQGENVQIKS